MLMLDDVTSWPMRTLLLVGGVLLNALATALYIGALLGPGPPGRADDRPGTTDRRIGAPGAHRD